MELFEAQLRAWGLGVGRDAQARLTGFTDILAGYERANVIGTKIPEDVLLEHVLDSLSCLLFPSIRDAGSVADVGSGGGLPGIPIQVVLPDARVVLLESTGKKVDFLQHAIGELRLSRTQAIRARAEEAGHDERHRSGYDVAVARAVARLSVVAEYCVPLVGVGGHVISMKGRPSGEEMDEGEKAAEMLGARIQEVISVPFLAEVGEKERRLVILEKVRETPDKYPRKPGIPAKNPLGVR